MNLEEAIEKLEGILDLEQHSLLEGEGDAVKLGIEALKREVEMRESYPHIYEVRLPGETD